MEDPKLGGNSFCTHTLECNCSVCREIKGLSPESKPPIADMISDFHLALREVSRVTAFGNQKHGEPGGWRKVKDFQRSYQNKKARHALEGMVQDHDSESGLWCLAHEAWNALALLQGRLEQKAVFESSPASLEHPS